MLSEHDGDNLIWLINLLSYDGVSEGEIQDAVARFQGGDHRSHLALLSPKAKDAWRISMKSGDSRSKAKKLSKLDPELKKVYLASIGADASRTGAVTKSALNADKENGDLVLDVMDPRHSLGGLEEDDGCGLWIWLVVGIAAIILIVLGLWIFEIPPFSKPSDTKGDALQRTTWSSTDSGYAGADESDDAWTAKKTVIATAYSIPVLAGLWGLYGYFFRDNTCPEGQHTQVNEDGSKTCVPDSNSLLSNLPDIPGGGWSYAGLGILATGLLGCIPCGEKSLWSKIGVTDKLSAAKNWMGNTTGLWEPNAQPRANKEQQIDPGVNANSHLQQDEDSVGTVASENDDLITRGGTSRGTTSEGGKPTTRGASRESARGDLGDRDDASVSLSRTQSSSENPPHEFDEQQEISEARTNEDLQTSGRNSAAEDAAANMLRTIDFQDLPPTSRTKKEAREAQRVIAQAASQLAGGQVKTKSGRSHPPARTAVTRSSTSLTSARSSVPRRSPKADRGRPSAERSAGSERRGASHASRKGSSRGRTREALASQPATRRGKTKSKARSHGTSTVTRSPKQKSRGATSIRRSKNNKRGSSRRKSKYEGISPEEASEIIDQKEKEQKKLMAEKKSLEALERLKEKARIFAKKNLKDLCRLDRAALEKMNKEMERLKAKYKKGSSDTFERYRDDWTKLYTQAKQKISVSRTTSGSRSKKPRGKSTRTKTRPASREPTRTSSGKSKRRPSASAAPRSPNRSASRTSRREGARLRPKSRSNGRSSQPGTHVGTRSLKSKEKGKRKTKSQASAKSRTTASVAQRAVKLARDAQRRVGESKDNLVRSPGRSSTRGAS